jgi:phosphatidate cytidylyltransferase
MFSSSEMIPASSEEKQAPMLSNFAVRYLTALVLAPLAVGVMFVGNWFPWFWGLMLTPLAIVGAMEFYSLAHDRPNKGFARIGVPAVLIVMLGFYLQAPVIYLVTPLIAMAASATLSFSRFGDLRRASYQAFTTLVGILYLGLPLGLLIAINHYERGFLWLVVIFAITWGTDTFAYAGGRVWGRHPLAPRLSPKKSVEGALVGLFGGFLPALVFLTRGDAVTTAALTMIAFGPIVAILGDLLESAMKRYYQIKDSHLERLNLIPGHGGVMDRIDALLMVTTFCYLWLLLTGIAI